MSAIFVPSSTCGAGGAGAGGAVGLGNGAAVVVGVAVGAGDGVGLGVGAGVGTGVAVGCGGSVGAGVAADTGVGLGVAVGAGVGVAAGVGVGLGVAVGTGVGVGCGVFVGSGVGVGDRVGAGDGGGPEVGLGVGDGVGVEVGRGVGDGVAVGSGSTAPQASTSLASWNAGDQLEMGVPSRSVIRTVMTALSMWDQMCRKNPASWTVIRDPSWLTKARLRCIHSLWRTVTLRNCNMRSRPSGRPSTVRFRALSRRRVEDRRTQYGGAGSTEVMTTGCSGKGAFARDDSGAGCLAGFVGPPNGFK